MRYYLRKLISYILTLLSVAVVCFLLFRLIPGDAAVARLGTDATPEQLAELRAAYGYDRPLPVRFFSWLGGALTGDFGISFRYSPMTVTELIGQRLPVTLLLAGFSLVLIIVLSIPLGLVCSRHPGGRLDRISDGLSQLVMAIPSFVQGILVTLLFGIILNAFTPGGYVSISEDPAGCLAFLFFPALSVALPKIAMTVRFMKTSVKRELGREYVRTARAKGCDEARVLWLHVFRNSVMPVITFIGLIVAEIMAGSIMIEQVFNLPGLGRLLVSSIANRDFNVVQAIVMYIAVTVITVNALTDVLYRVNDPRTRHESQKV